MPLAAEKERRFVDVPVLTVFHSISLYFISSFRIIQFVQSTPLIILPNLADQCNIRALVARALTFTRIAWINCHTAIVELLLGVHSRISIVLLNSLYPRNPSMPVSLHLLQLTLLELC